MNNFTNNYPLNGMYANNNIGGYMPSGYTQQQQVQPKMQNVLTPDEIKSLRKTVDKFSLGLTQEEVLRGRCTHKDENGVETLKDNGDGTVTCTICGYTFDPLQNCTEQEIQGMVDNIIDVLQTIKLLYIDIPTDKGVEHDGVKIDRPDMDEDTFCVSIYDLDSDDRSLYGQFNIDSDYGMFDDRKLDEREDAILLFIANRLRLD